MREIVYLSATDKDQERMARRGKDLQKVVEAVTILASRGVLPPSFRAHKLRGDWLGYWEYHLANDWLLVYKITETTLILTHTGSHVDLFE